MFKVEKKEKSGNSSSRMSSRKGGAGGQKKGSILTSRALKNTLLVRGLRKILRKHLGRPRKSAAKKKVGGEKGEAGGSLIGFLFLGKLALLKRRMSPRRTAKSLKKKVEAGKKEKEVTTVNKGKTNISIFFDVRLQPWCPRKRSTEPNPEKMTGEDENNRKKKSDAHQEKRERDLRGNCRGTAMEVRLSLLQEICSVFPIIKPQGETIGPGGGDCWWVKKTDEVTAYFLEITGGPRKPKGGRATVVLKPSMIQGGSLRGGGGG